MIGGIAKTLGGSRSRSAPNPAGIERNLGCGRGVGAHIPMGRDAVIATIMQGKPCRIMALVSGRAVPMMAVHAVGTNGRSLR